MAHLFKALLTWHDVPFRKTHSLEELGRQCLRLDETLQSLVVGAAPLSEYAWRFRYPGPDDPLTSAETDEALEIASAAFSEILRRLPAEAHPKDQ